jgi:hypothetical protein
MGIVDGSGITGVKSTAGESICCVEIKSSDGISELVCKSD